MLSRVADAVYWMSRYVERAENIARFIDVTLTVALDAEWKSGQQWEPLVNTTGDAEYFAEHYGEPSRDKVIRFLSTDADYPNSIVSCLWKARENARSVREAISTEMWEQLNTAYFRVRNASQDPSLFSATSDFFRQVKQDSHLFEGLSDGTMSHSEGWQFFRLGRMIERADKTSRLLDVKYFLLLPKLADVGTPTDDLQWAALLRSVSGFEMYRKRHRGITPSRVVGFLVLDRQFPRAIMFCINEADEALHAIAGSPLGTFWNPAEKSMGQIRNRLAFLEVDEIINQGLHEFIDDLQVRLNDAGNAIHDVFFAVKPFAMKQWQMQS